MPTEASSNDDTGSQYESSGKNITHHWTWLRVYQPWLSTSVCTEYGSLPDEVFLHRCVIADHLPNHLKASQLPKEARSRLWQQIAKSVTWFRNPGSAGSASLHYMNLGGPVWYGPEPMCPGEGRWCEYEGGGLGPRYRWYPWGTG
jgi:hypothetical protein